ncbi:hypothetical protein JCM1840_005209 [Sporobolomyces johnsonii]
MPRPRDDPDTTSQSDDSSDSPPPSRSRHRPRTTAKAWDRWPPRYAEGGASTDDEDTADSWTSSSASSPSSSVSPSSAILRPDTDDERTPRERRRRRPLPHSPSDPTQQQTRSCLVLFVGVAIALFLALLGGFALYKYFGAAGSKSSSGSSMASSGGIEPTTVTVTLSGGYVSTTTELGSSAATPIASSTGSTSSSMSSSGNGTGGLILSGVSKNNIGIGFLPDYNGETMSDITSGLEIKSSFYGWYAQLPESGDWDGSQLTSQMSDVKNCSCIFQPAVMPTTGWTGLTSADNSQALAIAKVMQQFTDEGIEVWLRFAHEVDISADSANVLLICLRRHLSQTDGTYKGTAEDFKEGWATVAAAVADNDLVKMFFTPNVAGSLDDYLAYMPNDTSTIDYLGFVDTMQGLYDQYCQNGTIKFAIGETGLGWNGTIDERLAWLAQITSEATATAMPNFVGVSWFNYLKGEDFRLWIPDDDSATSVSRAWFANGTVASGAKAGVA